MAEKKPKSLKKKIIYSAVAVLCIVGLGNTFIEERKLENLAAERGFESVQEFEAAQREDISTKSEYDAYLQKKDKAESEAAAQGGFLSVDEYRKAQSVDMPTKALYDKYLEQQAEIKIAEEQRKADEAEKARLAAIAEENRQAEDARLAPKANEQLKTEEGEKSEIAKIETVLVCEESRDYDVIALYSKTADVIAFSTSGLFASGTKLNAPMSKSTSSVTISHGYWNRGFKINRQSLLLTKSKTEKTYLQKPAKQTYVRNYFSDCRLATVAEYRKARNILEKKMEADQKSSDQKKKDAIENQKF